MLNEDNGIKKYTEGLLLLENNITGEWYVINDTSGSVKRQDDSDSYIQKYKSTVGRNFSSKKTNTHVKLVICDERCYLLGSMNVMSFSADYDKSPWLHHEVSLFSRDRETIRKLKKAYFNW